MQSMPITTKLVCSNPAHGMRNVHSKQYYVIKFVSDLQWFSPGTPISSTNKIDRNCNIVESGVKHHNSNPYQIHDKHTWH
jgi:hypothetical protein